ncbi:DUF1254 domain-containing protein [Pseudomonas sp. JUb96]|uniref:DUF1254 domain-containing protein n=1 Tax=Pseudomonas sp. JUb96 TaxID=2940539 RepID=UPI002227F4CB|nr:DUF1254 domain-containing protein [Pseudomonas sp. JUb96]MCW2268909.1 hypothetical protein [Pseudomonas sp. JUb96]
MIRTIGFLFPLTLVASIAHASSIETRFANLEMQGTLPTPASVAKLYEELDYQQATQSYLWALPIVAFAEWQQAHEKVFGAKSGDLVIYDNYQDKLGILTANATTPYIISFVNLKETGPLVIDLPAGPTAGGVGDFWQRSVIDLGQTGPDKGKGGKYLLLPPGEKAPQDTQGYYVVEASTMNVMLGFRVLDPDLVKGKALVDQFRLYPYAQHGNPPATRKVTPNGKKWYGGQPQGLAYWQRLHAIIQDEPVAERDRFYMAMLASLGIEKDKPFAPTAAQQKALLEGTQAGELIAKANSFAKRFPNSRFWPDRGWDLVLNIADPSQRMQYFDQLWERTAYYYEAVTNSKGMISKTPGLGQTYLGAYTDKAGNWLDGGNAYTLRVPAGVPAKQFWSVTVYDTNTRCLIDNPQRRADLSSRQELKKNADGSVDIYFGPTAPVGMENNWVQTVPGKHWFSYFRLYAPTQAYFDKSWKLNDIQLAK